MKKAFKHFIDDIKQGENIDTYITLFLALVFAILGVAGIIQIAILSAGILTTLSVLAYSLLSTRRTLTDLSHLLTSLQPGTSIALKDRSAFRPLKDRMESVNTIWLLGPSLVHTWTQNDDLFFEKVRRGGEIRILVFNPDSPHLSILAEQLKVRPARLKADIMKTLDVCNELVQGGLEAGKFEVRLTEMMPGYSMIISNPSKSHASMIIEFVGYHSYLNDRPHLEIVLSDNPRWFDYYLNQYQELWNAATACELNNLLIRDPNDP